MTTITTRRTRRTPDEMIADLEAQIAAARQQAAAEKSRPTPPKRISKPRSAVPVSNVSRIEDLLRAVAAELGLARAIAILEEQRQLLRTLGSVPTPVARDVVPASRRMERVVLKPALSPNAKNVPPVSFDLYERLALERALDERDGDKHAAARLLGIGKSTLYRKVNRLGVEVGARRELSPTQLHAMGVPIDKPVSLDGYERGAIQRALAESGGGTLAAAKLMRAGKSTFYRRMTALGVQAPARVQRASRRRTDRSKLLDYVIEHPGQRGREICSAMRGDPKQLGPAMRELVVAGKVRTTGAKLGMAFFAV